MSLIERQQRLVTQLEPIYRDRIAQGYAGMPNWLIGRRSKANRLHIEEMRAAGYSRREAAESAQQCNDIAALNAAAEGADHARDL